MLHNMRVICSGDGLGVCSSPEISGRWLLGKNYTAGRLTEGRSCTRACAIGEQLVRLTLDYGTDFLGMLARIEYAQGAIHGVEVVANLFEALLRSYEVAESSPRLARNALMT